VDPTAGMVEVYPEAPGGNVLIVEPKEVWTWPTITYPGVVPSAGMVEVKGLAPGGKSCVLDANL